jgi:hypothetical protein
VVDLQTGMCEKLPPAEAPEGTCTLPPRMIAEIILRRI